MFIRSAVKEVCIENFNEDAMIWYPPLNVVLTPSFSRRNLWEERLDGISVSKLGGFASGAVLPVPIYNSFLGKDAKVLAVNPELCSTICGSTLLTQPVTLY